MQSLKTIQYQKLRELNNPLRLPLSEYALQYKWKAPGDPSPLLLAENQFQQQKDDPLQNNNNAKVVPRYEVVFVSDVRTYVYCRYSQECTYVNMHIYLCMFIFNTYLHRDTYVCTYMCMYILECVHSNL